MERTVVNTIQSRIAELGISQTELAARCGEHAQTISAIMRGRRDIPIALSVKMDAVLGFPAGTVAQIQTKDLVSKEMEHIHLVELKDSRQELLRMIKDAGGFWSYSGIPEHIDDDSAIEAALVHLDLEEMPSLFRIWSRAHIKRVWKERLVSQGRRMGILNYILAVKVFEIKNPDKYITRYAKQ
ncbi:MAG: helix-turn-helix transcriptional regulator [Bacteroidales bacterium]|nr:helix-turn-helix transcriptional regulator [Bacteroidales bacterium]